MDYYSKKLTPVEINYTIGNKEILAVVVTLKHWRHLTQGAKHKMFVHIDHKKLMFFLEKKQLSPRQIRWLKKLASYDFDIKYIKGDDNVGADALSRKPDYKNPNKIIKPMLVRNGNYMQVAETTEKNNDIIRNVHDTRLTGHQKKLKILKKIQEKTTWKGIKANVEKYIKNCPICAMGKHDRSRKERLHQFLNPPEFFFSKTRVGFHHWVTGVTKPSSRDKLRHDLHDSRRIDKICKICPM